MGKKLGLILRLVNTIAVLAVLGLFVYTRIIFKHPVITESKERKKLLDNQNKPTSTTLARKGLISLDPITANLDPFKDTDGKQKSHFLTLTASIEIRDEKEAPRFEAVRPIIMDHILQSLSKKKFEDLDQVQGRYVFRSQIIDAANEAIGAPVVTEVYFSEFLLQ